MKTEIEQLNQAIKICPKKDIKIKKKSYKVINIEDIMFALGLIKNKKSKK